MATAVVKIEGSELELDETICKSDKTLKEALSPYYPAVSNADIKREEKNGQTVITVTKRAGSKGAHGSIFGALDDAEEWIHPALVLEVEGWQGTRPADVDDALIKALNAEREIARAALVIEGAPAQASNQVPAGF
jgi:hypothetical protein